MQTPHHVLKLSASVIYEKARFKNNSYNLTQYNGSNQINLYRGTLYFGGYNSLLKNRIRFYYDAYWQQAFNDKNNYRLQIDFGFDVPLWKDFFLIHFLPTHTKM